MQVGLRELEVVLPCPKKLFFTYNSQINGVSASFLIDTGTAISLQYIVKKLLVTHQNLFLNFIMIILAFFNHHDTMGRHTLALFIGLYQFQITRLNMLKNEHL